MAKIAHAEQAASPLAQTGIAGLDDVLSGGLTRSRLYLLEGLAGSGKTTLALQFLVEGARRGEPVYEGTSAGSKEQTA
jgi:circadian clock protein KaiC